MFAKIRSFFHRNNEKLELVVEDVQEFRLFFRQLCFRVKSHKNYEQDLRGAKVRNETLVLRFDLHEYLAEIHQYFIENGLYVHLSEHYFHRIMLSILAPDNETSQYLDASVSKELFTGVLRNVARESNIRINHLVKFYYEYIQNIDGDFHGRKSDDLLELYKAAISLIPPDEDGGQATKDPLLHIGILMDSCESFAIRYRRDLQNLIVGSSLYRYVLRLAILLFIMAALYRFRDPILAVLFSGNTSNTDLLALVAGASAYVALIFIAIIDAISTFIRYNRRKIFQNLLRRLIQRFEISNAELDNFFKSRFFFDYRKLK